MNIGDNIKGKIYMGLQKVAFNFMVERGGKLAKSLLCSKPQKAVTKTIGLKYAPALEKDTVQIANKETEQITKKADDLLKELRKEYNAEYTEKYVSETVENVAAGKVRTGDEFHYWEYKTLENFSKENPETFVLFGHEKGSAYDLMCMMDKYGETPVKIAKETPIKEIKKVFKEIDIFAQKNGFEPEFLHYMNMLIMKKHNPKTYNYLMNTTDKSVLSLVENWGAGGYYFDKMPSVTFFKSITPEQLHVMVNDVLPPSSRIADYVYCSDKYLDKTSSAVRELSKDLSKCKLSTDVKLYRGEKTVGMFDSVEVDKDFEKQLRQLLEANKDKAKNMKVSKYTGRYSCETSTNLYDFLSSKETLTLADGMQLAKFGDEKLVNELIKRIKTLKIVDDRFKSLSFDKGMANGWMSHNAGDNTTIIQNATVKQGTQGGYHNGSSGQYEVILNNTPKEVKFSDVDYHKDGDYFELDSIIKNI